MEDLDELHDLKNKLIIEVTNRCITVYPSKWEGVSKDILYNHNMDWVGDDEELVDFMKRLAEIEEKIYEINPYDRLIDENS